MRFLKLIFDENPLLFQSLSFDQGSQQGLHQDTAYVVVDRPLELAACWIALEDVQEGSGELMYAPGSHRHADWPFAPDRKHWQSNPDGQQALDEWHSFLVASATAKPGGLRTFLPKKGDVLVWHADLAHGGSPVKRPELTRQSLVGHFCPQSARPQYLKEQRDRATIRHYGELAYSSWHYALQPITTGNIEGGDHFR
jgi:ectoine hydroxylase-related dioxygenase (phytanoyl-CoA dioxygenase family)